MMAMSAALPSFALLGSLGGSDLLSLLACLALVTAVVLFPGLLAGFWINFLLAAPMRRRERARFFLDLLETALQRGQAPERLLVDLAATRDRTLGVRVHLLAAYLEDGFPLPRALERVPGLLPAGVTAMLKAGARLGNLGAVLPACRRVLREGASEVLGATNYAILLLLAFSPFAIWVSASLYVFVLPKFEAIMADMAMVPHEAMRFAVRHPYLILGPQALCFLALLAGAIFYVGGPRLLEWTRLPGLPWADWLAWRVPWKRRRLERTFSVMLTSLLDGGVPEAEAVALAGDCTGNEIVRRQSRRLCAALARGQSLPEALTMLHRDRELAWRWRNAAQGRGFLAALRGWHDVLEAQAFREEQTAAHLATTGMVVLNGALVTVMALATFGSLVAIIEGAVLW